MAKRFTAQVDDWTRHTHQAMTDVFRESARGVAVEVRVPKDEGGHMPVVSGDLRGSLAASIFRMPAIDWTKNKSFFADTDGLEAVIGKLEVGQTCYLGFRVPYAHKAEVADGNGFVRLTAQRWPDIVADAVRTVRSWSKAA